MDFFQLQLRQNIKGKTLYITIKLEIILPINKVRQLQTLYNSGAEINLIQYNLVKEYKLILLQKWWKPIVGFLNKYQIKLYSVYKLTVSVANIYNYTKVVGPQPF